MGPPLESELRQRPWLTIADEIPALNTDNAPERALCFLQHRWRWADSNRWLLHCERSLAEIRAEPHLQILALRSWWTGVLSVAAHWRRRPFTSVYGTSIARRTHAVQLARSTLPRSGCARWPVSEVGSTCHARDGHQHGKANHAGRPSGALNQARV